ncbi:MAG: tRNA preQ1(34) S-adenosylmethionine ribosyltransferase-isomerase QueA [Desulfobacteraceae bacterium]|nr:tRNA preQ1(34) S-adenosylmethionine ribosyltransferase-isomerase QueA [Desulfobacteraceae bacterium]
MYRLDDYFYELPEELIAQKPVQRRDHSRLLHMQRADGTVSHHRFDTLFDFLNPGDVLVLNNTKVIPARLLGRKQSGGKVEALILNYAQGINTKAFECLVKASKRPKPGSKLIFDQGREAVVRKVTDRFCILDFSAAGDIDQLLCDCGHIPLPPYIRREDTPADHATYQTVYAARKGAVAAPTAGLHFTGSLLERLREKGVHVVYLTLHVGYGTFVPVRAADIRDHRMHSEWFEIAPEAAQIINQARRNGGRVVPAGTTCVRTLEYCANDNGLIEPQSGACDLFIYPGYRFNVVDGMITNFHLPKSTLLMLVSAFAGKDCILSAYLEAVREKYRFYSYGDAMLIL